MANERDSATFIVLECIRRAAICAEPEMLDGMGIRPAAMFDWLFRKTIQSPF